MNDLLFVRVTFVAILATAAYFLRPFQWNPYLAAGVGAILGIAIIVFEIRLRKISLARLIGAVIGSILGIAGAFLISLVLRQAMPGTSNVVSFLQITLLLLMTYIGLVLGTSKGEMLNLSRSSTE